MLKKIKDFLGIEGVRLELQIPEVFDYNEGSFTGHIIITSQSNQTIKSLEVSLIEKYKRGRKESTLISEYLLGHVILKERIKISKDEEKKIPFLLEFVEMKSEMDKMEGDHFLFAMIVKTAKLIKGVKSTYRVEVKANMANSSIAPTSFLAISKN